MNDVILLSLGACAATLLATLLILRSGRLSLGLPFAYLFALHLEHVPGAFAHLVRPDLFFTTQYVALGFKQAAIGSVCFVVGLLMGRAKQNLRAMTGRRASTYFIHGSKSLGRDFWLFCLFGGWFFVYGLSPILRIPSIGAVIEKGGAIWILGVMLALRDAFERSDIRAGLLWLVSLSVYPIIMLMFAGFLSYGATAAIIVLSILAVSTRRFLKVFIAWVVLIAIGLTVFVNYYAARKELRDVLWSNAGFQERLHALGDAFGSLAPLDLNKDKHAIALHERLNQNFFAGLAADRLDGGWVDFRYGRSFYEAIIAPIPRAFWPDKPVHGGSGDIVRDMTGLNLSRNTSWGVGQVMELYINYGWTSLVLGFIAMGWLIGRLDVVAAFAERKGDVRKLLICFLPAVALIQPIGSLVEVVGGAAAAYLAALVWFVAWTNWRSTKVARRTAQAPKVARGGHHR